MELKISRKGVGKRQSVTGSKHHDDPHHISERRMVVLRVLVVGCLFSTAILVGYGSFYVLSFLEAEVYRSQYQSTAAQLENVALRSLKSKVLTLQSFSSNLENACPYESSWPNCTLPLKSYLKMVNPIIEIEKMHTIAHCPVITRDEVSSFEKFAYGFFDREGYSHLGEHSFGRGIYANRARVAYHDVNGSSLGRNEVLTPVLQIGNLARNAPAVMFNLYSEQRRINAIDDMIDCFHISDDPSQCSSITDVIYLVQDDEFRPAVLIIHPIAPKYSPESLKGVAYTVHHWDTIISYALPSYVSGLDVVLSVENGPAYTYRINNGGAIFQGIGDMHDSKYSSDKRRFDIPYFTGSVDYSITLYPTDDYVAEFETDLPLYACVLSVGVVVLTSLIFVVYDIFVNRQKYEKELIINTKRLFVRFISHEIRTPMNTVHLGLNLLSSEINDLVNTEPCLSANARRCIDDWLDLISSIGNSSDAAILVLNDLINYDKISMGILNMDRDLCCFWAIVGQAVEPFTVQARQANVKLSMQLQVHRDDGTLTEEQHIMLRRLLVHADTVKMIQVVRNLVSNAIKFTPEGGQVTVSVVWDENGLMPVATSRKPLSNAAVSISPDVPRAGSLVLTVRDSGAGMTRENLAELFQEGVQFNPNLLQAGGGSGLGLWISKGIIDLHDGLLKAHSEGIGKGSSFTLALPAYLSETPTAVEKLTSDRMKPQCQLLRQRSVGKNSCIQRILVVDDSTPTRKMVSRMLRNAGYDCIEAYDGQMCVDMVMASLCEDSEGEIVTDDSSRIDLILLDYEMPRYDVLHDVDCMF